MNSKRAKRIMAQARKNSRTGKVAIGEEYNRLKKEHKDGSPMEPYPKKKSNRQLRGAGCNSFGKKSLDRFDKGVKSLK